VHSLELWRNFIYGNETGSPGWAVSLHLACSGSQSEHRIHRMLPAHGACHIIIIIVVNQTESDNKSKLGRWVRDFISLLPLWLHWLPLLYKKISTIIIMVIAWVPWSSVVRGLFPLVAWCSPLTKQSTFNFPDLLYVLNSLKLWLFEYIISCFFFLRVLHMSQEMNWCLLFPTNFACSCREL